MQLIIFLTKKIFAIAYTFVYMNFIDTHAHLYANAFDKDREEVMKRALKAGLRRFYLPAIDSETHDSMLEMELSYPGVCIAMMGLHPCSVKENFQEELDLVENWLSKRDFAAVGEIGLDFYWSREFAAEQIKAFHTQIEWALHKNLPIIIHTRQAIQETIDIVKHYKGRGLKGIFHCFGDGYPQAKQIIDSGFLLGIGGILTYKNSGLCETLKQVPLEAIVLETDAPYLSPVPFRGKRNESSYLLHIAQKLLDVYPISLEEIAVVTTANALGIFAPGNSTGKSSSD